MTNHPDLFAALAAPFTGDGEVKSRAQGGRQIAYVTARTVMNRLDDVLGPENWWDEYPVVSEHSVVCALSVLLSDGRVLTKRDAGGAAGMADAGDDDKSMFSDAFKRAAVKFGVGRYLYRDGVPGFARASSAAEPKQPAPRPQPQTAPDPKRGRDRLPSQARPQSTPEPDRPRDGKALYRWCKTVEERKGVGMLKYLSNWGKLQDFGGRVVEWDGDQVYAAWQEGRRKLEAMESQPEEVNA